jgi:hypothetical protein
MNTKNCTTHNPREIAKTGLIRACNLIKEKPDFYKKDDEGNDIEVKNHSPKRRYEFNSADYFYLCDAIKYICTHHPDKLKDAITRYAVKLSLEKFEEFSIGKYTNQRHRLIKELGRGILHPKHCYIPKEDGGYYIMHPFTIDLETLENEKLTNTERKRLANLDQRKLGYITISFAKPLFEKYLNGGQYYKHPPYLYAAIYNLLQNPEELTRLMPAAFQERRDLEQKRSSKEYVSGYIKFIDYLYLHGAGGDNDKITVDLEDLVNSVMPSLGKINESGKFKMRDIHEFFSFTATASLIAANLEGLDYKIVLNKKKQYIETKERDGHFCATFCLEHPHKKNLF